MLPLYRSDRHREQDIRSHLYRVANPFGTIGDNTSERIFVRRLPSGTKLTVLNPNESDGGNENKKLYVAANERDV